ncbi:MULTISPECIES: HAD family hydrolase [Nocardiopsis]|uniref:HAD family hydrolase n=1 Tax=Nocardiopsis TaxID=2013 RepID=UPI00034A5B63|nr:MULTISPECIES: HAD family phosphatase [Nocardiopsis]
MSSTPTRALPEAVLFDMDGTLIDSEGLWGDAEAEVVAGLGGVWTEDDHHRNVGGAAESVGRYIADLTGAQATPREIIALLQEAFGRRLAEGADPRPGAEELVAAVAAAPVRSALVTSTERLLIEPAIGAIGLGSFDLSVGGDEVEANKPDPAPYLKAARLLGVDPARCVAVEDSVVGVASALAAGCATIAVPMMVPIEPAEGLTVVDSLEEVGLDRLSEIAERHAARSAGV